MNIRFDPRDQIRPGANELGLENKDDRQKLDWGIDTMVIWDGM